MGKFVARGSKVCLLPNAQRSNPGTFTKPEIVRAVAEMCREAGASEVSAGQLAPRIGLDIHRPGSGAEGCRGQAAYRGPHRRIAFPGDRRAAGA